jgi:hypothetical protein
VNSRRNRIPPLAPFGFALGRAHDKRHRQATVEVRYARSSPRFGRSDVWYAAGNIHIAVEAARQKAREILDQLPHAGYAAVAENWRQLPDGRISSRPDIYQLRTESRAERRND